MDNINATHLLMHYRVCLAIIVAQPALLQHVQHPAPSPLTCCSSFLIKSAQALQHALLHLIQMLVKNVLCSKHIHKVSAS